MGSQNFIEWIPAGTVYLCEVIRRRRVVQFGDNQTHTCLNRSKFPGPFRHPLVVWPGFDLPCQFQFQLQFRLRSRKRREVVENFFFEVGSWNEGDGNGALVFYTV